MNVVSPLLFTFSLVSVVSVCGSQNRGLRFVGFLDKLIAVLQFLRLL